METRMIHSPEFRAEENENKKTIAGYAAMFNSWSSDLGGFRETIQPGAFKRTLEEQNEEVRFFVNHRMEGLALGRSPKTLRVWEDDLGLAFELDVQDSPAGQNLYQAVKRGDINQMSFGFEIKSYELREEEDEVQQILKDVELFEISAVNYPAYEATKVSARTKEQVEEFKKEKEEPQEEEKTNLLGLYEKLQKQKEVERKIKDS